MRTRVTLPFAWTERRRPRLAGRSQSTGSRRWSSLALAPSPTTVTQMRHCSRPDPGLRAPQLAFAFAHEQPSRAGGRDARCATFAIACSPSITSPLAVQSGCHADMTASGVEE